MLVAVGEPLFAEVTGPAGLAATLPRLPAGAVHTARVRHAFGAVLTGVTHAASAAIRSATAAVFSAATRRADRCADERKKVRCAIWLMDGNWIYASLGIAN